MNKDIYRIQMEHISKRFGGVCALDDVSLRVQPGEVHALVGENGAGKSTLIKVLAGAVKRDSGTIKIDGKTIDVIDPKISKDLGVAVIYQEFMLAPDLSVAENIFIDRLCQNKMLINWKQLNRDAEELLTKIGFGHINPKKKVGDLTVAYQQVIEICKSFSKNAKIFVLDEPTAVLTFNEIDRLFELIEQIKAQGMGIVYVSHRLEEIFRLCDKITVLKDGKFVTELETAKTNEHQLVNYMVGRELSDLFDTHQSNIGDVLLEAKSISAGRAVKNVSFKVHKGEILGFSGLVGSGRTETMRAIFGADKLDQGQVIYKGSKLGKMTPKKSAKYKIGLLPEDRKNQGVLLEQSIRINTTLTSLDKICRFGIINKKKDKSKAKKELANISTKYGKLDDHVLSLSGGNQQKVALAKWLAADCECIILDEPTRGVDVGAKAEIYKCINRMADEGIGIVMISSEMEEIINICDRVIVMRQGEIVGELGKDEIHEQNLIKLAMGVK